LLPLDDQWGPVEVSEWPVRMAGKYQEAVFRGVIPVIPFSSESQQIRETAETGTEVRKRLEGAQILDKLMPH
jgi:hypothetical protein